MSYLCETIEFYLLKLRFFCFLEIQSEFEYFVFNKIDKKYFRIIIYLISLSYL
jgi:hypothetical protein